MNYAKYLVFNHGIANGYNSIEDARAFNKTHGAVIYGALEVAQDVTQPAAPCPFEVGKVYKNRHGYVWEILTNKYQNDHLIAMTTDRSNFRVFDVRGKSLVGGDQFDLIPDQSPATTRVEFVPVKESES